MKKLEDLLLRTVLPALGRATAETVILGEPDHPRRLESFRFGDGDHTPSYFHYHNMPEFCCCIRGTCVVQVDTAYFQLHKGDACIVNRNTHHAESFIHARQNYEVIWFIFPSVTELLTAHCRYHNRRHQQVQSLHLEIPKIIVDRLDSLFEGRPRKARHQKTIRELAREMRECLGRPTDNKKTYFFADKRKSSYQIKRILRAQEYIQEHFAERITLKKMAEVVELNPDYFDRLFHQITRHTFVHFLTTTRLQQAQKFMNETHLTLSEISYRVGFNDPYYFSKVFKKYYGLSPRQFRDKYTMIR